MRNNQHPKSGCGPAPQIRAKRLTPNFVLPFGFVLRQTHFQVSLNLQSYKGEEPF